LSNKPQFAVIKSHSDGCVGVRVNLRGDGWNPSVSVQASASVTVADARALAADLIRQADDVDDKETKKRAKIERRQKYWEREIAAGRMKVFTPDEFFGSRR